MIYKLRDLLDSVSHNQTRLPSGWFPARPLSLSPIQSRIYAAYLVLKNRADVIVWPEDEDVL